MSDSFHREEFMRWVGVTVALVLIFSEAACNRTGKLQTKDAIQAAIEERLKSQPNMMMNNMNVEVQDVTFSGDTADANVKFRSKQAPNLAVGVRYRLRLVEGKWKVESSAPLAGMGGDTHPHGGELPPHPGDSGSVTPQPSH